VKVAEIAFARGLGADMRASNMPQGALILLDLLKRLNFLDDSLSDIS
jgi:hypothetical protein